MKFQQLVMLAVLLVLVLSNTYEDNNEGLCLSDSSKNCSDTVQKYGVCCDQGGTPKWIYYRNYCLACRDVHLLLWLGLRNLPSDQR
jgi:hypothetical protein